MPTTTLPDGAQYVTGDADDGHRVAFTADLCHGAPIVRASCTLTPSGAIADDPAEEAPAVHVVVDAPLTAAAARGLAAAIIAAAEQAEQWQHQAADDAWADPAWQVNSDYCARCNTIGQHATSQHPA
ncbi:hypothetical protein C731_1938 [Mycolicibacterium hassiacum DSM 44199]|uniref:Uncharacterized protein n=1 Tax=Mycolicibacterium hassiacum (strain DSM 44199 / CIP 105218 / JCM 12690 / 3849) TaxID=1122247 RepID=K5B8P4_MYCHD|nr:hypothetical protein [Mycolicibacterium hassiacum]EKF24053.1 hypothetical protein C731_1938 [Mycolicibacterium hassiacum DSM 44199]MDA4088506.1 hypothetical protein [Mycolicibacterium hassiacum DSM 44199]VCT90575.1 hypothetical protein MHAS_02284 [Mycolicibacterium hassiacum DSM 44199]